VQLTAAVQEARRVHVLRVGLMMLSLLIVAKVLLLLLLIVIQARVEVRVRVGRGVEGRVRVGACCVG
jgi:hypothetical protein